MHLLRVAVYSLLLVISNVPSPPSDDMQWLVGTWRQVTDHGVMVEQWKIANDSTLTGKTFAINKSNDTMLLETIQLAFRGGQWFYLPTVEDQNDGKPVRFTVIYLGPTDFISENPVHDYPQRITYRRIKQQLFASVEGRKNGRYRKQHYDYIAHPPAP